MTRMTFQSKKVSQYPISFVVQYLRSVDGPLDAAEVQPQLPLGGLVEAELVVNALRRRGRSRSRLVEVFRGQSSRRRGSFCTLQGRPAEQ